MCVNHLTQGKLIYIAFKSKIIILFFLKKLILVYQ